jgi:hypothetical protein
MPKQDTRPEPTKSVGWVAAMLAVVVAYFGWAFLAADYFQNDPNSAGKTDFWGNSIEQLSNMASVLSHAFQHRLWLIGIIVGAEVAVMILWVFMKKMERELWGK